MLITMSLWLFLNSSTVRKFIKTILYLRVQKFANIMKWILEKIKHLKFWMKKKEKILQFFDLKRNYSYWFASSSSVLKADEFSSNRLKLKTKEILLKHSIKEFKNICFNKFDLQRDLLKQSWTNCANFNNKRRQIFTSYEFHFFIYFLLFNICWIAKVCNQISHVEDSISFNDSRLSDVISIVNDICHTFYTAIPLFCPLYKYWEKRFERIDYSSGIKDDEYIFAFLSIYIILAFVFIIIERFVLLGQEELKSWIKFIKLVLILIIFWAIWRNYILDIVINIGIPNCFFIMNIVWNIMSKKTVTEDFLTAPIKFMLHAISPAISIKNYYCQWLDISDFKRYFTYFRIYTSTSKLEDLSKLMVLNKQNLWIQSVMICILLLQKKHGSLFFLPSWLRTKIYENMKRDITKMSQAEIESPWMYWTNLLWQRELFYTDNFDKMMDEASSRILYETKWGLIYHQKCFYKILMDYPTCSHWGCTIPKDGWDD